MRVIDLVEVVVTGLVGIAGVTVCLLLPTTTTTAMIGIGGCAMIALSVLTAVEARWRLRRSGGTNR